MKKIVLTAVVMMGISAAQAEVIVPDYLMDDNERGFTCKGNWSGRVAGLASDFNNTARYVYSDTTSPSDIDATATWAFTGVADGTYAVLAAWPSGSWPGAKGDFAVTDGGTGSTVSFDKAPNEDTGWIYDDSGATAYWFQKIGTVTVSDGTVEVVLSFSSGQAGTSSAIVADAVALVGSD